MQVLFESWTSWYFILSRKNYSSLIRICMPKWIAYMFGELIPSLKAFLKKSFELQMYISFSHKTLDLYYKFD